MRISREHFGQSSGSASQTFLMSSRHLPTGEVNPNFGRPFIEGYTLHGDDEIDRRTTRLEGYIDLDLAEKVHPLLGRHVFTFLYNKRVDNSQSLSSNEGIAGHDHPYELFQGALNPTTGAPAPRLPTNAIWRRWYLADSIDDLPLAAPRAYDLMQEDCPMLFWDMDNGTTIVKIPGIDPKDPEEELTGGWRTGMFHLEEQYTGGSIARSEVESKAVAIQSYLLRKGDGDGHYLVTTLGFRNDDFTGFGRSRIYDSIGAVITDRRIWSFPTEPTSTANGDTFTFGVVGHILPFLSVHYNDSENFEAAGILTTGTGIVLGVPTGETEEYSFTLKLFKNKLYAKVNWYEMNEINASDSAFLFRWRIPGVERRFYLELRDQGMLADWVPPNFGYGLNADDEDYTQTAGSIPGLSDVSNRTTSGMEVEVVVNPAPNWRFMFNAAQQIAFLKDRYFYSQQYLSDRLPIWERFFDVNATIYCQTSWGPTLRDCYNRLIGSRLAGDLLFEGRRHQQLREWRWHIVTTYEFEVGFLRDVDVGGALRWEEAPAIGNAIIFTEDGAPVSDLDNTYYGEDRFSFDYWVGYEREIWNDRMTWKIRLNVRNAFVDNNELYPTHAQPDGSIQLMAITEPTDFFITNSFSF